MSSNETDPTESRRDDLFVRSITASEVHGGCHHPQNSYKDLQSCGLELPFLEETRALRFLSVQPKFQSMHRRLAYGYWSYDVEFRRKTVLVIHNSENLDRGRRPGFA